LGRIEARLRTNIKPKPAMTTKIRTATTHRTGVATAITSSTIRVLHLNVTSRRIGVFCPAPGGYLVLRNVVPARRPGWKEITMLSLIAMTSGAATVLWILAVVLVIWGIITLVRGGVLAGVVLIIVGLLVGPGGVSIFR